MSDNRKNRVEIINAVKTPLGFYTLLILIVESILFIIIFKSDLNEYLKKLLLVGIFLIIILLIIVVTILAIKHSHLFSPNTETKDTKNISPAIEFISNRQESDNFMLKDMSFYKKLDFMGISQSNLPTYLKSFFHNSKNILSWETINIYFASKKDGQIWNGNRFMLKVQNTRHELAYILTKNESNLIPNFKEINFLQINHHSTFGGCMFSEVTPNNQNLPNKIT